VPGCSPIARLVQSLLEGHLSIARCQQGGVWAPLLQLSGPAIGG
jgi:hypothetical protein